MTQKKALPALLLVLATAVAASANAAPSSATVDFSTGEQGWVGMQPADGNGGSGIDTSLGKDAPAYRTTMENFGIDWRNSSNAAFLGDYTKSRSVTLGLDVSAMSIQYFGQEVTRSLVVELRDYDNKPANLPYASVWFDLGTLDASNSDWRHFSVTIDDTSSSLLPSGWGGYGAEDASGMPVLPGGRSFASVLSSVDEIVFTTLKPGYGYGFTNFNVAIDNVSITAVPEPSTYGMLLGGMGLLGFIARRRQRADKA
jgi:hypothetical protein